MSFFFCFLALFFCVCTRAPFFRAKVSVNFVQTGSWENPRKMATCCLRHSLRAPDQTKRAPDQTKKNSLRAPDQTKKQPKGTRSDKKNLRIILPSVREFYAVVKGGQVGLALSSVYQDLGIPMMVEIQSDSSSGNCVTDRLGAGQRTKHIDTRYFWKQERVQSRWRLQFQEGAHSEKLRRCWNEASLCFRTTTTLQVCRIGILLTMDPTLHYKMIARAGDGAGDGAAAQKQQIVNDGGEHRDGCAS